MNKLKNQSFVVNQKEGERERERERAFWRVFGRVCLLVVKVNGLCFKSFSHSSFALLFFSHLFINRGRQWLFFCSIVQIQNSINYLFIYILNSPSNQAAVQAVFQVFLR